MAKPKSIDCGGRYVLKRIPAEIVVMGTRGNNLVLSIELLDENVIAHPFKEVSIPFSEDWIIDLALDIRKDELV